MHERWDMLQALARSHARSVGHVKAARGEAPSVDLSAVHKDADMQRCLGLPVPDAYPAITSERLHPPSAGRHFTFTTACHVPTVLWLRAAGLVLFVVGLFRLVPCAIRYRTDLYHLYLS